jgi:AP-2 complex subunit alpha
LGLSQPGGGGQQSAGGVLIDVLGDLSGESLTDRPIGSKTVAPSGELDLIAGASLPEDNYFKFVCKNNGVLFENDLIQIGVKCEFRQNLGRLSLFYGNKTAVTLKEFVPVVKSEPPLSNQLNVQTTTVDTVIEGGAQKQQIFNVECVTDFAEPPVLTLHFLYSTVPQKMDMKLPVSLNKFMEPTQMDGSQFFQRWKLLSQPAQEAQKIFKAQKPIDIEYVRSKLVGFGMSTLDGIDPNPDNFVCASIVHSTAHQVGCLLRLEPNRQVEMYRLTVRASKDSVAKTICELLERQL